MGNSVLNEDIVAMKRNVLLLSICLALMMSATSLMIATSPLIGLSLASSEEWATLPLACVFIGSLLSVFPASFLMKFVGRRAGFVTGLILGIIGACIATMGILNQNFYLFCGGSLTIGFFNGFGQFYRFAAADVANEAYRSRAISWVMAGGVVAAFLGPNLANWSSDWISDYPFAGSYATLAVIYGVSIILMCWIRIPLPTVLERRSTGRRLAEIAIQPIFVVAALGAVTAYGIMNLIMTSTPIAMTKTGHTFSQTAFVFQWHVFGMYAPSFFTGYLIKKFGVIRIMMAGLALIFCCVFVNLQGQSFSNFWVSLFLLGLGWNFVFIGSTTLVTESYTLSEKAKTQGLNDFMVWLIVAVTALSSGWLSQWIGWRMMNILVLPVLLICLVATIWLNYLRKKNI